MQFLFLLMIYFTTSIRLDVCFHSSFLPCQVFRDLFKEALNIQKERIKDVRQYASDQRKRQESRRQDEIDSLENLYPFN